MGFGPYPEVSLAQARKMRLEARELVAIDKDPKEEREITRYQQRAASEHTLHKVAEAWFDLKKKASRSLMAKPRLTPKFKAEAIK